MSRFPELSHELIPYLVSSVYVLISLIASGHVILTKREPRAAVSWIGLIWLSPLVGIALYTLLGINRIHRRSRLQGALKGPVGSLSQGTGCSESLLRTLPIDKGHLSDLARLLGELTGRPLLTGNDVKPLADGDRAYPVMLAAIEEATLSISLGTYIFNNDRVGLAFVEALGRAVDRGVAVRVLVDDLGSRYDWPSILGPLRQAGVPAAAFLPTLAPGWFPYLNLRNHRKLLVVDGQVGFTGGMNINESYSISLRPIRPTHDLHFRIRGPVVAELQQIFADDWAFCTGESLVGPNWFPPLDPAGSVLSRGIPDGPDNDMDHLLIAILGALACARSSVSIVTPYFLPELVLISALTIAAMRGVRVDIILPRENNQPVVKWASTGILAQVLERGCRVWYSPPPFDHSKLMIVDEVWVFFGSGNWDPRSFRLNFEFNLECYSSQLAASLEKLVRAKIRQAEPITLESINRRSMPVKLRDGIARLFSPCL
ncbi:phospholipase D-like domain-containing protein [Tundrisphaera lichenicola]|uniref:phospholipase D-like domain-containing protein n=1 Tax=Tundrisphaera lichenicola TaxID=2029860 RepID=UPI003EB9A91F